MPSTAAIRVRTMPASEPPSTAKNEATVFQEIAKGAISSKPATLANLAGRHHKTSEMRGEPELARDAQFERLGVVAAHRDQSALPGKERNLRRCEARSGWAVRATGAMLSPWRSTH